MTFRIGEASAEWAKKSKIPVWHFTKTDSTNKQAKGIRLEENSPIATVFADHQSEGRGRSDHSWSDVEGASLLSSWVFQLPETPQPIQSITIGLAVLKAFTSTWPFLHFSLKAPNDLYLGSHKLGGLLIENLTQGTENRLIIGLGVNIHRHPAIENAIALENVLKGHGVILDEEVWNDLLDRLLLELSLAVSHRPKQLSRYECLSVLEALNRRPNAQEKFLDLDSQGTLTTDKRKILWSEL